jgi:prepilin-type N-terminal cleavage/methylation domain-containing protein
MPRSPSPAHSRRGITLIELMVVLVIIGILVALAAPAMGKASDDRKAFSNTVRIGDLLRSQRAQAMTKGTAHLVVMTTSGLGATTDRGHFIAYEGVGGAARSCSGNSWTALDDGTPDAGAAFTGHLIDAIDFNDPGSRLVTTLRVDGKDLTALSLCYSPDGTLFWANTTNPTPNIDPVLTRGASLNFSIVVEQHDNNGLILGPSRQVIVPGFGSPRIKSQ